MRTFGWNVGKLKELIKDLPDDTPIRALGELVDSVDKALSVRPEPTEMEKGEAKAESGEPLRCPDCHCLRYPTETNCNCHCHRPAPSAAGTEGLREAFIAGAWWHLMVCHGALTHEKAHDEAKRRYSDAALRQSAKEGTGE